MSFLEAWSVKDFDPGAGAVEGVRDDDGWIPARAPGDLHLALVAAGRLPDPFQGEGEDDAAWVADREWWWRARFDAPAAGEDERLTLVFHGLDTFATLWLNDAPLGCSDNMFVTTRYDVTDKVRQDGPNTLAIRFAPATASVAAREMELWPFIGDSIARSKRNFIRKAQFGWGWDWGPILPTVGVWRPVELKLERRATLRDVRFSTLEIAPDQAWARVRVEVDAEAFAGPAAEAHVVLRAPDGTEVISHLMDLAAGETGATFTLPAPRLWWTPELGEAALYTLETRLRAGGEAVDRSMQRVGVRTVTLDTSPDPDEPGATFFRFVLNGAPVFARGVCWIPASSFVGAVGEAEYRPLLEAAKAANMNMVRVWGGGVYEHEAFYDLCDELGLLVWQDFMFACAPYPQDDPAFVDSVATEVRQQIVRLRNHPSLAMWCGNNEANAIHAVYNRLFDKDGLLPGRLYYDEMMPALVAELDASTPYWPSSPTGGPAHNSMRGGDVHNWTVWHGVPPVPNDTHVGNFDHSPESVAYTRYAEDMARFVSEYGIQASPVMETLRRRLKPEDLRLGSPGLLHRIKDKPKDKVNSMLVTVTGLPTTLEDYVDFTQITQAEGLKFGIEHYRRRKPHCSGSLIWQYNDCWPCVSWSLLDYDGFAKASWFYVRRAYAHVMASFRAVDGGVELWITNDTLRPVAGEAEVTLVDLASGDLWSEAVSLAVGPNEARRVWRGDDGRIGPSASRALLVRSPQGAFPDNRMFFAPIKDLALPAPKVESEVEAVSAHELRVRLRAPAYAFFTHLTVPHGWTLFSDNYFDMRAGEERIVTVKNSRSPLDAASVAAANR